MRERVGDTVIGALGEMAFSKCTRLPWPLAKDPTRALPDVGGFELKSTAGKKPAVRLSDPEAIKKRDRVFILAVGFFPRWEMVGWCYGAELQEKGEWREDLQDPCWELPKGLLHPMWNLPV